MPRLPSLRTNRVQRIPTTPTTAPSGPFSGRSEVFSVSYTPNVTGIGGEISGAYGELVECSRRTKFAATTLRLTAECIVLTPAATGCYKFLSFVHFTCRLPSPNCYRYNPDYALFRRRVGTKMGTDQVALSRCCPSPSMRNSTGEGPTRFTAQRRRNSRHRSRPLSRCSGRPWDRRRVAG